MSAVKENQRDVIMDQMFAEMSNRIAGLELKTGKTGLKTKNRRGFN